jgi:hypothetical protein
MTLYPDKSLPTATRRDRTPNRFSREISRPEGNATAPGGAAHVALHLMAHQVGKNARPREGREDKRWAVAQITFHGNKLGDRDDHKEKSTDALR